MAAPQQPGAGGGQGGGTPAAAPPNIEPSSSAAGQPGTNVAPPVAPPPAPAAAPPPAAPPAAPQGTPPAAAPQGTPPAATPPTGDPGDFNMSREQFNQRIAQAKQNAQTEAAAAHRQQLIDYWGTDDPEEIKRKRDEIENLRKEKDERDRAQMSELERAQSDLAKATARASTWETRYKSEARQRQHDKQTHTILGIAARHIDPDLVDDTRIMFARHLRGMDEAEIKKMGTTEVDAWFSKLAKDKPAFAKKASEPKPPPAQQPITNGPDANKQKPAPTPGGPTSKTPRPGQPNSMSDAEYAAWKKDKGYTY